MFLISNIIVFNLEMSDDYDTNPAPRGPGGAGERVDSISLAGIVQLCVIIVAILLVSVAFMLMKRVSAKQQHSRKREEERMVRQLQQQLMRVSRRPSCQEKVSSLRKSLSHASLPSVRSSHGSSTSKQLLSQVSHGRLATASAADR